MIARKFGSKMGNSNYIKKICVYRVSQKKLTVSIFLISFFLIHDYGTPKF